MVLHENGQLELGLAESLDSQTMLDELRSMPVEEWSLEHAAFRAELSAVFLEAQLEEPLVEAGVLTDAPVPDEVGARASCLEAMASAVAYHFPDDDSAPGVAAPAADAPVRA